MSLVHVKLVFVEVGVVIPHLVCFQVDLSHPFIVDLCQSFLQALQVLSRHVAKLLLFLLVAGVTHADRVARHPTNCLSDTIND